MAISRSTTVSLPLPSSRRGLGWGDRVQRVLLHDRTLGYLFLFPAILVIVGLVAYVTRRPSMTTNEAVPVTAHR